MNVKKLLASIISLMIISTVVHAADNQSAKYVRLLSRNAATDSIDSVYFNPAGTAFLQKGSHIQLNGQTVRLRYSYELKSKKYTMTNWVPFIPSAYVGYNGGNWAVFAGYSIPQGGGDLKWDSIKVSNRIDNPTGGPPEKIDVILDGESEGESSTHMLSYGASYAFSPIIAVGARFDISLASAKYEASQKGRNLDGSSFNYGGELARSGYGFGGALGVHVRLNEEINASLTVESTQKVKLHIDEESHSEGNKSVLDGLKTGTPDEADTPWVIRAGLSYTSPFGLEIPISFKYSFWEALDTENNKDIITAAVGFRYWPTKELELSLGGSYANGNKKDKALDGTFLDPELESFTIGTGIGLEIFDNFNIDVGFLYPFYLEADGKALYKKLNKQVVNISLGVGYIF